MQSPIQKAVLGTSSVFIPLSDLRAQSKGWHSMMQHGFIDAMPLPPTWGHQQALCIGATELGPMGAFLLNSAGAGKVVGGGRAGRSFNWAEVGGLAQGGGVVRMWPLAKPCPQAAPILVVQLPQTCTHKIRGSH